VIIRLGHAGRDNFIVHLLDSTGETVDFLVNVIGAFDGSKALAIDQPGDYLMNIEADGRWSISIEQPVSPDGHPLPMSFKGQGQTTLPFIRSNGGLTVIQMTHTGQSNFIVHILDQGGGVVDFVTNVIGPFAGSKSVPLPAGVYLLQVEGEGAWTIAIAQ
jgi:hypothetical protein